MHHVLNSLFDLGKSGGLTAVVQHGDHRVHAPEHLCQHLVLKRQGQARGGRLGESVVPLVCWLLRTEERQGHVGLVWWRPACTGQDTERHSPVVSVGRPRLGRPRLGLPVLLPLLSFSRELFDTCYG